MLHLYDENVERQKVYIILSDCSSGWKKARKGFNYWQKSDIFRVFGDTLG